HICNMLRKETGTCPHCKKRSKTVDHLATQCDRMLYHDYTRRHNEVVRCIHLGPKYIIYMYYHCGVLANKLGQEYGCRTRIIPYVMTWDGVVTKYHRRHLRDIEIIDFI
ncbi:hypothetical protein PAEPH01_2200, partial [Pancytospora epiphaga]